MSEIPKGFGGKKITQEEFEAKLQVLTARVLSAGDADLIGVAIERLGNSLGFIIANVANGDGKAIDDLLLGVEGYIHEAATSHMPMAIKLAGLLGQARQGGEDG